VATIVDLLASGMTWEEIRADYAGLESEDIQACLHYAVRLLQFRTLPLAA